MTNLLTKEQPVSLTSPLSKRAVSIRGDLVIKAQDPEASRRERLRTVAGGEVGQATGLFMVPEIVSYDDALGEITFRRLELKNFRQILSQRRDNQDLIERIGSALAAIHERMTLPDTGGVQGGTRSIQSNDRLVPLHGDFGLRNVFGLPDPEAIAIIDWSNADWTGVTGDVGLPEIDVGVFLISLFHRRIFGPWPVTQRHQVARRFLAAYSSASPCGLDVSTLREVVAGMSPAFTRMTRRRKGSLHALACRHAMIDLQFFLRRLSNPG